MKCKLVYLIAGVVAFSAGTNVDGRGFGGFRGGGGWGRGFGGRSWGGGGFDRGGYYGGYGRSYSGDYGHGFSSFSGGDPFWRLLFRGPLNKLRLRLGRPRWVQLLQPFVERRGWRFDQHLRHARRGGDSLWWIRGWRHSGYLGDNRKR